MKKIYKKLLSSILLFVLIFSNMFNAAMFSSYGLEPENSNNLKVQTALSKLISHYENFDGTYNDFYDPNESLAARNAGMEILQIRRAMKKYGTFTLRNASRSAMSLIAAGYNPRDYEGSDYAEVIKSKFMDESNSIDLANSILALDMANADYDEDSFIKHLISTGREESGELTFGSTSYEEDDWGDWGYVYHHSSEDVALVTLALSKHSNVEGASETIEKTLYYLKKRINPNGMIYSESAWGSNDDDLNATIYTIQALKSLSIDPYTSSDWISSDSKTLLDGVLSCYMEDEGRFANSSNGTMPAQLADSIAFLFLSEEAKNSSVYDLRYMAPGDPSYIKTSLADTVDAMEDEVLNFSAYAYDSNDLPLETRLNIIPENTDMLDVDSSSITMKKAGTTKLVISAEGFNSVKKEIIVNIKALNGLSKEKKAKLQSEIDFLKDKYAVYNNYEFLSSPAASLSSMDKEHIKSNLMEYSKVNNLALLTKTAISMIGAGLDPREFIIDGEKKNLIDELKASQIKSGERKGQFALNPMDLDEAEYQAWAIITLYSANASYDSDAAIDALVKLLDGDYKKSTAYKEIQTEGACLIALGLYRDDSPKSAAKADELISWLMGMQNKDGGFNLAGGYFANSPMATASVVQGLLANGINPMYNPNWVKNENTPLDSLLKCKYESSNVMLQGYAKSEEKIGADYKATYLAFAALVDMLNDESMFNIIKMSPVSVNPGAPAKIELFGGFKPDAEINSTQYIDAFLFDSSGNLVSQKPSMKILDTDIATISGNEFKALKQGSTQLELKYGSIIKTIDIKVSDPEPTVDPDKDKIVLEDKDAYIVVRVEGNQGTLSSQQIKYTFTKDSTPLDILKSSVGSENIEYTNPNLQKFITSILGESKSTKDGWSYCMKGLDGEIVQPMIGVSEFKALRNDKNELLYDEFIFYKSYFEETSDHKWLFHTKTPEIKVSVNGNEVSVTVKDKADKSPLEGVSISSDGPDGIDLATTDSNGSATFTLDENKTYDLTFTRYEGGYATLLKMYRKIEIDSYLNNDLVKNLSIKSSSNKIKVGDVLKLETSATTKSGSDIDDLMLRWSSSKNDVAKVDQNGLITALNSGNTVIKAVYESVYSTTYKQDGYLFDEFSIEVYDEDTIKEVDLEKAIDSLRSYTLKQDNWNYEQALFYRFTGDSSDISTIGSKISINNDIKNPTDLAGNIMSLIAADLDPYNYNSRNYVAELMALQQTNGSFKKDAATDNQTIFSIIALDMADASYDKDAALSYLASKQKTDGSIGFGEDDTGMYLVALSNSDKYDSNINRAVQYLHSKQGQNGIINNAYSSAWVIHGLVAIGEDPSSDSWTKKRSLADAFMSHLEGDHFKVVSEWGTDTIFISKQAPLSAAELVTKKSAYNSTRTSSYGERVDVSTTSLKLLINETAVVKASIKDRSGKKVSEKTPVFSLSDPSVAGFDSSNGVVKGLKFGKCKLTVSHPQNPSLKVNVLIEVVSKKGGDEITGDTASIGVYGPDGRILSRYKMPINRGDDVMSFTRRALDNNNISYKLKDGGGYVAAIDGIKEFQYGKHSGWKFYVDGKAPGVGADSVTVKDSMKIEWRYTTNYKKDGDYDAAGEPVNYEEKAQKLVKKIDQLEKKELKERLKDINSLVGRLEREEDARILEGALIDLAKEIQKESTQESKEIMDSIKKVYLSSLENFSTVKIDEDNKLDKNKVKESIKLMDKRYEDIQKKLEKANIKDVKLKKELVLDFSELDSTSVTIDSKASSALKDSTSESISIKTDDAKLELKKDFFEDKDIKLEVSKISTKDHKDITDRGSVIVDINLQKGRDSVSEFDQPVKISIPYKGIVVNPDLLCVYYLDDENKTTKMGGIYDKEDGMITFEATHLSKYFAKVSPALLADSAEKAWAKKSIEKMAAKGILEGYDGKFNPSSNMTKAEFVTMTVRLVNLKSDKNSRPRFADVDSNAWYYKNIQSAIALELIEDASSSKFNPDTDINREEAAMIVFNALKARKLDTSSVSKSQFTDASDISAASMKAVMNLRSQGLLKGDQNNNFNPKTPMTRAECAVFIDRLYDHMMNN